MEELRELIQEHINKDLITAVLSNPRGKDAPVKVKARPLLKKDGLYFQIEVYKNNQVFHQNAGAGETCAILMNFMSDMRQMQLESRMDIITALVSKKGRVTIRQKRRTKEAAPASMDHNRKKRYILEEGMDIPFLRDLGVMTAEGKIVRAKFGKFRQINRFLEFIEDILPQLDIGREVTVLDFGCGKSYLTFAMYYYLHELRDYDVRIIGLDLKKDVVRRCSELGKKYGFEKLTFLEGDIANYTGIDCVDMVVTLHACDTATDYALAKAVEWDAKVILSVPCCQHELNSQIKCDTLGPVLKYGLIKERMSALITDALRAEYLEMAGYDAQALEFIDMEHTPKNILIRAVKTGRKKDNKDTIKACETYLHVAPTLGRLLES